MITYVKILAVFYTFNPSYVKFFAIFYTLKSLMLKYSSTLLYNLTNRFYFFKMIVCFRTMFNKYLRESCIKIEITMT